MTNLYHFDGLYNVQIYSTQIRLPDLLFQKIFETDLNPIQRSIIYRTKINPKLEMASDRLLRSMLGTSLDRLNGPTALRDDSNT